MTGPFQREPLTRDEAYLSYVRTLPCCGCGFAGRQNAHHAIGQRYSSAKASDLHTFPLCAPCHTELHRDWRAWEEVHGSQWMFVSRTAEKARHDGVLTINHKAARNAS